MNLKKGFLTILYASLLLLAGCGTGNSPASPSAPVQEQPDQSIELQTSITTVEGEVINVTGTKEGFIVDGYEGKVVLFEVFAWWCSDCKATVPILNSIKADYGDNVVIIAIEDDGIPNSELQDYVNTNSVSYKAVAKANSGTLLPYLKDKGTWRGEIPYVLVVGGDGTLYTSLSGPSEVTASGLTQAIQAVIQ